MKRPAVKKTPVAGKNPLRALAVALKGRAMTMAVAESCTGGLLGSMITGVPGSSEYFTGGVIAYSNEVKKRLLGVEAATLEKYGAVSSRTAKEMAEGVRRRLRADAGVSITGIAGPGGGTARKPVGTVYIGVSTSKRTRVKKFYFEGSRKAVRKASALAAIGLLKEEISG
ncbi:MAG: hypothetical protein BMS9Abin24_166 [Thermodesulfobacteriota bacterium]|nr:MAG: hypothetical protein BMS9Abin24_166 [Thermodesulfobacteriota bacterium]